MGHVQRQIRTGTRLRRLALAGLLAAGACWLAATGAGAAQRVAVVGSGGASPHIAFQNLYLSQLACASASQCTAVEPNGTAVTFAPTGAGAVTTTRPMRSTGTHAIVCPSTASCAEADGTGHVAVFAPRRTSAKAATFTVAGAQGQTTVACPSAHECVAETFHGSAVFDPAHPGSPTTTPFTANGMGGYATLSCPSSRLCVGTNGTDGTLYSYAPHAAASAKTQILTPAPEIGPLDCTSRSFCVALAASAVDHVANAGYITFDPSSPGHPTAKHLAGSSLDFLTCASATLCAGAGGIGGVVTFNPQKPGHSHITLLSTRTDVAGIAFAGHSLVLLSNGGDKAVINPSAPPKTVKLVGLSQAGG